MKKTIRMPKELLAKWLAALRSGEYQQTRNEVMKDEVGCCCLGVLVEVTGEDAATHVGTPNEHWMEVHNVAFYNEFGKPDPQNIPYLPQYKEGATHCNDVLGLTFREIADAIEECAEGF